MNLFRLAFNRGGKNLRNGILIVHVRKRDHQMLDFKVLKNINYIQLLSK